MYSRSSSGRTDGGYRIPEGYRGNAFSPISPPIEEPQPNPEPLEAEVPPAEATETETTLPVSLSPKSEPRGLSPLVSLLPPKPSGTKGLLGDIGLEELLILGVILLVSQSETDDDILLFLILLLFYK